MIQRVRRCLSWRPIPYPGHGESARTALLESHNLDQAAAILGQAVLFFEGRVIIVGIPPLHDECLVEPAATRRRSVACARCIAPGPAAITRVMPMQAAHLRLANAVIAIRGKGHDAGNLLDLELLARPAQAVAQYADRRHEAAAGSAEIIHVARAAAAASTAAGTSLRGAALRSRRGGVGLRLDQALRIVAVRGIEAPAAAEIHARRRRLVELFARTGRETQHGQKQDEAHGESISRDSAGGPAPLRSRPATHSVRKPRPGLRRVGSTRAALRSGAWFAYRRRFCRPPDPPESSRPGKRWVLRHPSEAGHAPESAPEYGRRASSCRAPRV